MLLHELSFIHWLLIAWILLIFLKSIVTLCYSKSQDQLLWGIILVLGGVTWILSYWFPGVAQFLFGRIKSEISVIDPGVFMGVLISLILILHGIKLAFKHPWKQILVILTVLLFVVLHVFSGWGVHP